MRENSSRLHAFEKLYFHKEDIIAMQDLNHIEKNHFDNKDHSQEVS